MRCLSLRINRRNLIQSGKQLTLFGLIEVLLGVLLVTLSYGFGLVFVAAGGMTLLAGKMTETVFNSPKLPWKLGVGISRLKKIKIVCIRIIKTYVGNHARGRRTQRASRRVLSSSKVGGSDSSDGPCSDSSMQYLCIHYALHIKQPLFSNPLTRFKLKTHFNLQPCSLFEDLALCCVSKIWGWLP